MGVSGDSTGSQRTEGGGRRRDHERREQEIRGFLRNLKDKEPVQTITSHHTNQKVVYCVLVRRRAQKCKETPGFRPSLVGEVSDGNVALFGEL
jgi:hypothetical protein